MAAYIQVENQKVKRGNFYFVGEATGDDTLSDRFFDMEKHFYTNRARFSQGMRLALEKFVYSEYCRIYGTPYDATCSIKEAEDSINGKILEKTQSNLLISNIKSPIKAFLCLQCSAQDKLALYEDALRFWRKRNRYTFSDLKRAIFDCYEFACNEHHENPPGIESYDPNEANEENCTKWLQFLHAFLCAYCKNHFPDHTDFPVFDKDIIPIEEYVRVPRSVSKKLNVPQVATKALYVSGDMENIKYYWICDADQEQAPNREIDVLQKIWAEDNDIDPRNVIRLKEKFHVNETLTKLVFSFPSACPGATFWKP